MQQLTKEKRRKIITDEVSSCFYNLHVSASLETSVVGNCTPIRTFDIGLRRNPETSHEDAPSEKLGRKRNLLLVIIM